MKKTVAFLLAVFVLLPLCACGEKIKLKQPPIVGFFAYDQFSGYRLGYVPSLSDEKLMTEKITDPELVSYNDADDAVDALCDDELHGVTLPAVYAARALSENEELKRLPDILSEKKICALVSTKSKFVLPIDSAISSLEYTGVLQRIAEKNLGISNDYKSREAQSIISGRTIKIGISSENMPPFTSPDGDTHKGINLDIANEIAVELSAEADISYYSAEGLIKAIESGEIDLALANYEKPESFPDSQYYTSPYFDDSTYILIKKKAPAEPKTEEKAESAEEKEAAEDGEKTAEQQPAEEKPAE